MRKFSEDRRSNSLMRPLQAPMTDESGIQMLTHLPSDECPTVGLLLPFRVCLDDASKCGQQLTIAVCTRGIRKVK